MRVGARLWAVVWVAGACSSSSSGPRQEAASPEAACQAGRDPQACVAAAELYFDGKGGHPLDHAKSFRYASAACEEGHAFGCALVGYHLQDGLGTAWAPDRAVAAYQKACAGGAGVGCYNLATMYSGGHGVTADQARVDEYKAKAKAAWQAACDGSEPRWCTNVAYLLREEDEKGNRERALALDQRTCDARVLVGCTEAVRDRFALGRIGATAMVDELDRLCRAGEPTACTAAGSALVSGSQGVAADATRGMALVVRGCEIGDKQACALAGVEHASGQLVTQNAAAADRYLTKACDHAMGAACMWIARDRVTRGEVEVGAAFARRACQMGEREACAALGALYLEGRGVAKDEAAGERWTTESCRMGYPPACAVLLERGRELPVPPDLHGRMVREACAAGVQRACQLTGRGG
ncbi:MAG TPA: hypothetical protein VFU21_18760 [Kofleriaceae bacterium]|nr:hypothetical protein [Kofleriaceae bacterium]